MWMSEAASDHPESRLGKQIDLEALLGGIGHPANILNYRVVEMEHPMAWPDHARGPVHSDLRTDGNWPSRGWCLSYHHDPDSWVEMVLSLYIPFYPELSLAN